MQLHHYCVWLSILLIVGVAPPIVYGIDERNSDDNQLRREQYAVAEEAYQALFAVRTADEINRLAQQWANNFSLIELDDFLHLCWEQMTSTVSVERPLEYMTIHHDLNIRGGRCAWIFEQLTHCQLPPITGQSDQNVLASARGLAFEQIINIQKKQRATERLLVKAAIPQNKEEKLRLANNPTTIQSVLMALADDQDAEVRLAVAKNPQAFPRLRNLTEDSDERVREAALQNLQHARMPTKADFEHDNIENFIATHPIKTLIKSQEQPVILPWDISMTTNLRAMRSTWKAASTVRMTRPGPHTLAEAVAYLVRQLNLPAPPAFCTEDAETFYCSASTSLQKGADLSSGFAIKKGDAMIYSWGTSAR